MADRNGFVYKMSDSLRAILCNQTINEKHKIGEFC